MEMFGIRPKAEFRTKARDKAGKGNTGKKLKINQNKIEITSYLKALKKVSETMLQNVSR